MSSSSNHFSLNSSSFIPILSERKVLEASRYGFNGKMKDNEVEGEGDVYDFGARMYDARLGRFMSLDPKIKDYPWEAPYVYADDKPIRFQDLKGEGAEDRVKAAREFVGKGIKYSQAAGKNTGEELRTGSTPEALKFLDCSELVCRVLNADNITDKVLNKNSEAISIMLGDETKFQHSESTPKVGDIAVWGGMVQVKDKKGVVQLDENGKPKMKYEGHVGIVSAVGKDGKFSMIHATYPGAPGGDVQEQKVPITAKEYVPTDGVKFKGFFRPKTETPDNKAIKEVPVVKEDAKVDAKKQ